MEPEVNMVWPVKVDEAVKQLIKAKGWTQKQASAQTGVSMYAIRHLTSPDWQNLRASTLIKFFEYFGIHLEVHVVENTPR